MTFSLLRSELSLLHTYMTADQTPDILTTESIIGGPYMGISFFFGLFVTFGAIARQLASRPRLQKATEKPNFRELYNKARAPPVDVTV